MAGEIRHLNIKITGRVQGIGFRYTSLHAALQFGIKGFVRNIPDGSVYIEAEGTDLQLENFISWCRQGPPRSKIMNVSSIEGALRFFTEFEIR